MLKLTNEQVSAVDKALLDIGIKFVDIRIEMTDHVATALEGMEGDDFNRKLDKYIFENKKELKKNYSQFSINASIKAVKLLFHNMISFRFIAILVSIYALVFAEYKYEGLEETSWTFFITSLLFIMACYIYIGYVNFVKSTKLFSTAERLMPCLSGLGFSMIIPLRIMVEEDAINDAVVLFYYAFSFSFFILTTLTYKFLNSFYSTKYQLN